MRRHLLTLACAALLAALGCTTSAPPGTFGIPDTAIITRLAEQLRDRGVRTEPGADLLLEIQVVRISVHPKPQFTCVIDFNRKLGGGPVRGLQSRAESWDARKACSAAASQVVIDTLNDQTVRDYLKGA